MEKLTSTQMSNIHLQAEFANRRSMGRPITAQQRNDAMSMISIKSNNEFIDKIPLSINLHQSKSGFLSHMNKQRDGSTQKHFANILADTSSVAQSTHHLLKSNDAGMDHRASQEFNLDILNKNRGSMMDRIHKAKKAKQELNYRIPVIKEAVQILEQTEPDDERAIAKVIAYQNDKKSKSFIKLSKKDISISKAISGSRFVKFKKQNSRVASPKS